MKRKLDVLLMVDMPSPAPEGTTVESIMTAPDWDTEIDVLRTLRQLGHDVRVVGLFDDIRPLLAEVERGRPDIVFNLVEHFNNDRSLERDIVGLIELLGLPYTGNGPTSLMLSKNKGLMKQLLTFHRVRTPKFDVLRRNRRVRKPAALRYPFVVKPSREDSSYGISQASFVQTDAAFTERVRFVHETMNQDALVEEYVEGRELYVGVIGNERFQVLAPREMVFRDVPEDEPKIATFKAKWDWDYREKWGIQNRFANPLAEGVIERIEKVVKRVCRVLQITGYARIDIRLTPDNEIMVLEANPNPGIADNEDLPLSAEKNGLTYPDFIQKVVTLGLSIDRTLNQA